MSEPEQRSNRGGNEPSGREQNTSDVLRRKLPGVNFEELNFEQRRAPYNSEARNAGERKYNTAHGEERAG